MKPEKKLEMAARSNKKITDWTISREGNVTEDLAMVLGKSQASQCGLRGAAGAGNENPLPLDYDGMHKLAIEWVGVKNTSESIPPLVHEKPTLLRKPSQSQDTKTENTSMDFLG